MVSGNLTKYGVEDKVFEKTCADGLLKDIKAFYIRANKS
jgi:hypothetical protein